MATSAPLPVLDPHCEGGDKAIGAQARALGAAITLPERLPGALGRNWDEAALRRALCETAQGGLVALAVPREQGGQGAGWTAIAAALEGFGEGCADVGLGFVVCDQIVSMVDCLAQFGTEAQRTKWLPALALGQAIGAQALTEPEAGSDVMGMATTATKTDAGGYCLNGRKTLIGLAARADFAITFAVTDPSRGAWGLSAFLVERGDPGFETRVPHAALGLEAAPLCDVTFNDCRIPADRLIGSEGMGWLIIQQALQVERAIILATQVGVMARQLTEVVTHARARAPGGQAIAAHQSVGNRIADMSVRLETSRLILRRAAEALDAGENIARLSAMAKLHISESFAASSLDAVRIMGGRGYLAEFEAQQQLRDSVGALIYAGTSDIQRQIIASLTE